MATRPCCCGCGGCECPCGKYVLTVHPNAVGQTGGGHECDCVSLFFMQGGYSAPSVYDMTGRLPLVVGQSCGWQYYFNDVLDGIGNQLVYTLSYCKTTGVYMLAGSAQTLNSRSNNPANCGIFFTLKSDRGLACDSAITFTSVQTFGGYCSNTDFIVDPPKFTAIADCGLCNCAGVKTVPTSAAVVVGGFPSTFYYDASCSSFIFYTGTDGINGSYVLTGGGSSCSWRFPASIITTLQMCKYPLSCIETCSADDLTAQMTLTLIDLCLVNGP